MQKLAEYIRGQHIDKYSIEETVSFYEEEEVLVIATLEKEPVLLSI